MVEEATAEGGRRGDGVEVPADASGRGKEGILLAVGEAVVATEIDDVEGSGDLGGAGDHDAVVVRWTGDFEERGGDGGPDRIRNDRDHARRVARREGAGNCHAAGGDDGAVAAEGSGRSDDYRVRGHLAIDGE